MDKGKGRAYIVGSLEVCFLKAAKKTPGNKYPRQIHLGYQNTWANIGLSISFFLPFLGLTSFSLVFSFLDGRSKKFNIQHA